MVNSRICHVPDPAEDPLEGWMLVTRHKPSEEERQRKEERATERVRLEEAMEKDPVTLFLYQQEQDNLHAYRRAQRDPKYARLTNKQLWAQIKSNASNAGMPVVLRKSKKADGAEDIAPHKMFKNIKATYAADAKDRRVERNAEEGRFEYRMFDMQFIRDVVAKRLERKLTQAQLGALVDVTESDIKRFERGEAQYSAGLRARLIWKLEL